MSAFPKDAVPVATKVGLPGAADRFDPQLRESAPSGHRSLDIHVVRQMLGSSFWSMRVGSTDSIATSIAAQLASSAGPDAREVTAEALKALNLVRDGGAFLAALSAQLPIWHQRLTKHETGRGATCQPELAALGEPPEICLTEVRGLKEALDQLGSGRNPGFDQGVSAASKAIKGFGIATFRKIGPLVDYVEKAFAVDTTLRSFRLLLSGLAEKEPTSAAEAAIYLQNLRTNEATIRAKLPRDQAPAAPPSPQQIQSEAMKVNGSEWRALFTPRSEEAGRLPGFQRLALGYSFFALCLDKCVEGRAAAAHFAALIRAADQSMVREAIGVLEARQLCPTIEVRKTVEPLLAPPIPPASGWKNVPAAPAVTSSAPVAPASSSALPATKPGSSTAAPIVSPRNGQTHVSVAANPAPNGEPVVLSETKPGSSTQVKRQVEPPAVPEVAKRESPVRDHLQKVETELMARFGTRDFASAVLRHNPELLRSDRKLETYLGVLDRTRPIWEPMIARGALRPQDVSNVGLLDNIEFYATLTARLGPILMREVMRVNPGFREARQARAEYLTLLDEVRPAWEGKLGEPRIAALVVSRSGLETLQFESELSKRFGDNSVFHAASRRSGILSANERRETLAVLDAHLPLFKKLAASQPPVAILLLTPTCLETLAEQNRDVVALEEIRKAVLRDGLPIDVILPVLRYGLLEEDGKTYALARVGESRLYANLKKRISNFSEVEPLLREAVNLLAADGVRAFVLGKNGYGLNQYKSGELAPKYPSLVRLIEWVREHPPGVSARETFVVPAAFVPTTDQPAQTAFPILQLTQSKKLIDNLLAAMRAIKPDAALPNSLGSSATALGEMAPYLRPAEATSAVGELIRCYSVICSSKDDVAKQQVLTAIECVSTKTADGANTLIGLSRSQDVLLRRISAGILMQAAPELVDAARLGRKPSGEEVILAVFDYIDAETDKQFKQGAAENFMGIVQAHTPSWDVVYEVREKHRLGSIFLAALVEGFHD